MPDMYRKRYKPVVYVASVLHSSVNVEAASKSARHVSGQVRHAILADRHCHIYKVDFAPGTAESIVRI